MTDAVLISRRTCFNGAAAEMPRSAELELWRKLPIWRFNGAAAEMPRSAELKLDWCSYEAALQWGRG